MEAATGILERARLAALSLDGGESFLPAFDSEAKLIALAIEAHKLRARLEEIQRIEAQNDSLLTSASQPQASAVPPDPR